MARRGDGIYQRGKTWYLDCRIHGTRHVYALGKGITRTVAKELASVKRAVILKGEAGIGKKKKDCRFEKAKEEFLKWAKTNTRPNTYRTYEICLGQLQQSFSGKSLSQITPWLVETYKQQRKTEAPIRTNRELAVLKMLFNRCREWEFYEGENPVTKVKFLKESNGQQRYLEPHEETALLAHAHDPLRSLIILGIYTGLRIQSEALTLRWKHIDFKRNLITVEACYAKSGEMRVVNMNSLVASSLKGLAETSTSDYVFGKADGSPYQSMRKAFETACRKSGLRDITPHALCSGSPKMDTQLSPLCPPRALVVDLS